MSATNETELTREELEQRVRSLEGQLAAVHGPNVADPHEADRPWKVAEQHVTDEHTRPVAPLPYRGEGAVLHHFPHITGGSGGPVVGPYVRALAELLAELGYVENGVIKGELAHFDNTMGGDIARFRRDHDVRENTSAYHGHNDPAEDVVKNLVGPYTIQALFDAVAQKTGQDVQSLIGRVEYDITRAQRTNR